MTKHWTVVILIIAWLVLALCVLFTTDGIGDNGDGIMHYLFARYAHLHPEIFLDPWAKTGFTLVAWPFAQFGFQGIKFMNILSTLICLILVYRICGLLKIERPWSAVIILSLSTLYFRFMFTGLTEHIFSLVLIIVIFLLLKNKWILATLVLSTLPFFRQEGYIIMFSLLPFYVWKGQWKMILLFPASFIIVGVIGGIYNGNLFWIIKSNPYGFFMSYGKGSLFTFVWHLYHFLGLINLIFFVIGLLYLIIRLFTSPSKQGKTIFWLVFFPFFIFFMAHSIFWAFGIFNSFGMPRVLNCVTPLIAIIGALGFTGLLKCFPARWKDPVAVIFAMVLICFPFVKYPFHTNFSLDFSRNEFEENMRFACYYAQSISDNGYVYYEHPLVPFFLNIDRFDIAKCDQLVDLQYDDPKPGSVIIWENVLTQLQSGRQEAEILTDTRLTKMYEVSTRNKIHKIIVFKVK